MVVAVAAALALLSGCGFETSGEGREVAEPFIAASSDFDGFLSWEVYALPDTGLRSGHGSLPPSFLYVQGTRDVPFDEPLPVGTMIVRTRQTGAPEEWTIHAMVKRGGGFNAGGARGWEWFDLRLDSSGHPLVAWRGAGDAADPGGYGPDVDGSPLGCNDCHAIVPGNDYVFTRGLISD